MTKADLGVAVLLLVVSTLFFAFQRFGILRREKLKAQRYPLFAVRHRMVMLVVNGIIAEDDPAFKYLYTSVNACIPRVKALSLRQFLRSLRESKIVNDSDRSLFLRLVNNEAPEVRQVARDFFSEITKILFSRSPAVRLYVRLIATRAASLTRVRWPRLGLRAKLVDHNEALRVYRKLSDVDGELRAEAC